MIAQADPHRGNDDSFVEDFVVVVVEMNRNVSSSAVALNVRPLPHRVIASARCAVPAVAAGGRHKAQVTPLMT